MVILFELKLICFWVNYSRFLVQRFLIAKYLLRMATFRTVKEKNVSFSHFLIVSRWQREPSVKTLRSQFSAKFWRRVEEFNAALCLDSRAKKWKYETRIFHFFEWETKPKHVALSVTLYAPAPRLAFYIKVSVIHHFYTLLQICISVSQYTMVVG